MTNLCQTENNSSKDFRLMIASCCAKDVINLFRFLQTFRKNSIALCGIFTPGRVCQPNGPRQIDFDRLLVINMHFALCLKIATNSYQNCVTDFSGHYNGMMRQCVNAPQQARK